MVGRITIGGRQESDSVQHDSEGGVGPNFRTLTLSSLFQAQISAARFEFFSGDN